MIYLNLEEYRKRRNKALQYAKEIQRPKLLNKSPIHFDEERFKEYINIIELYFRYYLLIIVIHLYYKSQYLNFDSHNCNKYFLI